MPINITTSRLYVRPIPKNRSPRHHQMIHRLELQLLKIARSRLQGRSSPSPYSYPYLSLQRPLSTITMVKAHRRPSRTSRNESGRPPRNAGAAPPPIPLVKGSWCWTCGRIMSTLLSPLLSSSLPCPGSFLPTLQRASLPFGCIQRGRGWVLWFLQSVHNNILKTSGERK